MQRSGTKKSQFIILSLTLVLSQSAQSWNSNDFIESRLLKVIDTEFLKLADEPEELEWDEDYGFQPIDGYELDYSEKCTFIATRSRNKKALTACALLIGRS